MDDPGAQTAISLCVYSDDLTAEELTLAIGVAPTETTQKGTDPKGYGAPYPHNTWILGTDANVDSSWPADHFQWLADQMVGTEAVLAELRSEGCSMVLHWTAVTTLREENGGGIPAALMKRIADLGFDIEFEASVGTEPSA